MIPFDYITEWRAEAPWAMEAQVEQDLILSRAVVSMFAESEVASRHAKVHPARVVECFARYLEHDGLRISRAELELNLHEKLSDETFLSDVKPLIAPDTVWSFEDAAGYVQREILPFLPGESWRGDKESVRGGPHGTAR